MPQRGWGYSYNNKINPDIDLSVTGWNVQALKAAEHGGVRPTKGEIRSTLRKASLRAQERHAGRQFSYKENGNMPRSSLVGVGVLSLQMTGNGSDSAARKGLDWIKTTSKLSSGAREAARKTSRAISTCITTACRLP